MNQETGQSCGYGRFSLYKREGQEASRRNQTEKTSTDVDSY